MSASAAIGTAEGVNSHETAQRAVQQALNGLGSARPVLAAAILPHRTQLNEALAGMNGLLGNIPLWGFSSSKIAAPGAGDAPLSAVILFSGSDLKAQVSWMPFTGEQGPRPKIEFGAEPKAVLLAGGSAGEGMEGLCGELSRVGLPSAGGLSSGDPQLGRTFQFGAGQTGSGAAAAVLGGKFQISTAAGHGWRRTGAHFEVTQAAGSRILTLDGKPVVEVFSRMFGYPAQSWLVPPLNDMLKLYPLEIETSSESVMRRGVRFNADGSLLLNGPVTAGAQAHLMIGDANLCLQAARDAARTARLGCKGTPLCALVLADTAWDTLFETRSGQVMKALSDEMGSIPFVYAATNGQIYSKSAGVQLENQAILVVLFSAKSGKD